MNVLKTTSTIVALVFVLAGCSETQQARRVETSGFLGDYSMLQEGKKGEALLIYRNPEADLRRYSKVLVEPISIWRPAGSNLEDVPEEELQALGNYLYDAIVTQLAKDYEIVDAPGPGVLRIRGAITEVAKSWVVLDTVTAVAVPLRGMYSLTSLATGTNKFVGRASIEGEITDSETGVRLFAAVDRRAGNEFIRGSWTSWDDVKAAYTFWAKRLRNRLREAGMERKQPQPTP